ncbi:MAG: hypothetical protein WAW86_10430 [Gammaproteobacteria bacterium]
MYKNKTKKCSWNDIKNQVKEVNPLLFSIIENDRNLIPEELSILDYSYGQQVGDESFFYFPDNSPSRIMPFCMVLQNNFEMYMEFNETISPWKIFKPGQVFPYTKFLKNNSLYEPSDILKITAGIRNSFMLLNQFSDKKNHNILKKHFNLSCNPPKLLQDQFLVFKEICQSAVPEWSAQLLAFPQSWEKQAYQSPEFTKYLSGISSDDHIFKRNILLYDYLLNTIILKHTITNNSFAKDVVKYLLYIACGDQAGYAPTLCEKNGPISFLRDVYINTYRTDSSPIYMIPHKLTPFDLNQKVYYSINKCDFLFRPSQISNLNKLSQEIKYAFEQVCIEFHKANISKNTLLYKVTSNVELEVLHRWNKNSIDSAQLIKSPMSNDHKVIEQLIDQLEFPSNSQFLSGCFSLQYKNFE